MSGRPVRASGLVDRYELVNRREIFPWVAEAGLLGVAKRSVVTYLRSTRPAYLVDLRSCAARGGCVA